LNSEQLANKKANKETKKHLEKKICITLPIIFHFVFR